MNQPNSQRRISLVVNPSAGGGRAAKALPSVVNQLEEATSAARVVVSIASGFEDARSRCSQAVAELDPTAGDALVVMGGDGMAHLGLNACAETGVPLGVVPAGRGNDFCRGVGSPTTPAAAVAAIVSGQTSEVDLIQAEGALADDTRRRFVGCIVSTGFDSRVGLRAATSRVPLGSLTYAYAALAELATFRPLRYRLLIDNRPLELEAMMVCVGNTRIFGGGMLGCPNADPRDGELDLTVIRPVSRPTLLRLLPAMYSGRFVEHPAVELLRARSVIVDGEGLYGSADGEPLGTVPLQLTVRPRALSIIVG